MKFFSLLISFLMVFASFAQNQTKSIGFIENKGQIVDQKGKPNTAVKYLLNTNGLNVQIRNNGFSYDVYDTKKIKLSKKELTLQNPHLNSSIEKENEIDYKLKYIYHRIDIDFDNSNSNVKLIAEEKSTDYDNYYNVIHAPNGITNVYKYQKITYKNIYNNIDVVFFIPEDKKKPVEYNFILNPGSKIEDIHLKFNGAKTELVDNKIKMNVRFGLMEETLPLSWVENNNSKEEIAISYKKIKSNVFGFESSENFNVRTLIIDPTPTRLWGTFYGGSGDDYHHDICIDLNNNVLISGFTYSLTSIATAGTHLSNISNSAGFIAKFDTNGNRIWGTYYFADPLVIKVDSNSNIYGTGNILYEVNLGTVGSHQPLKNNFNDAFLIKLNSNGIREWATYYGGDNNEYGYNIAFDNTNNVYLCGNTNSNTNISTTNSHQENRGSNDSNDDGFLVKFDENGVRLWATYYGGSDRDGFQNCYFYNGFLYLTGVAWSDNNISTAGCYKENKNNQIDSMIVKFDINGNRIWGTYIGGEDKDYFNFQGDLKNNFLYLIGSTHSHTDIGTIGTFYENYESSSDGLSSPPSSYAIIKFDVINQTKVWGTYFPGKLYCVTANNNNELYFSGSTTLNNGIATTDGYQPNKLAPYNAFLIKLNSSGQQIWGTYYSGNVPFHTFDAKNKIDFNNNIYIYGRSNGTQDGLATINSHQFSPGNLKETFLVKFLDCQSAAIANSNSPVCIGNNIQLNASGGTNYSWTGPNGFTSTMQNPVITNSTALNNGQYSCTITGTIGGCDDTISTNVNVGDNVAPIPNVQNLPTITGDCNTVITSIPTATDNCAGNIVATTTDALNYSIPGNYTIHWTYNDGNGNSINQNQSVTITSVATPTLTSPQNFCFQQNATLNNITITGQNIIWYTTQTGGIVLPTSTLLQNGSTYYASQTINGCESARIAVTVNIQNTQVPIANSTQSFCSTQNATLSNIVISGTDIKWYSSNISTIVLPITTVLQNGITYFATQTVNNCESSNRTSVTINLINTLNASNYSVSFCDDLNDNFEILDLTNYNQNLLNPTTGIIFTYYYSYNSAENQIILDEINPNYTLNLGSYTIFVRIDSSNGCHQIVELELSLFSKPLIRVNEVIPICEGNSITIDAGLGYDTYLWSTGEISQAITVSQAGNYWVTLTQNHNGIICSETKSFEILLSNIALITSIETLDWNDAENYIIINTSGNGDYEYSIDGINFQNSNVFLGVYNGNYDVIVRDKNGCGLTNKNVTLLNYPKYFTPNGDGFNDYWKIKFSEVEPNLSIKIFDRFGKVITILNSNSQGWDGTYNEKPIISDDYWFIVTRENGKEYKGHFSLKR